MATESTPLYNIPNEQDAKRIAEDRKADALRHFKAIRKAGDMESISSLKIGWNINYLRVHNLFQMLGFGSEDEARKASGVGRSTWYSVARLAESFNGLEEDQFTSMKLTNAQILADLPESKRLSREWVRMAGSMGIEDFAVKIDEEMNGKARASEGKERSTILKMPMPVSRKTVIEEGAKEYGARIGLDENEDISRSIELMVIEKRGQTSLVQSITDAVQRIKAAKALSSSGLSADEILAKVYEELDAMVLEFAEALQAVQNSESHPTTVH
jgi:hypothetical protein